MIDGAGQGNGVVEGHGSLDQGQDLLHGGAESDQLLVQAALTARRPDAVELPAHGLEEGGAVEVLVLVQVIPNAHAHGVQWRRLVGETGDHDGDHLGIEEGEVFQELQAVVAGPEVPVEDGQVDGVLIGLEQGGLGVGRGQDAAAQVGSFEPFPERLAHRLLVIDDEDGFCFGCHVFSVAVNPGRPQALNDRSPAAPFPQPSCGQVGRSACANPPPLRDADR